MYFHGARFSNYEAWLSDPTHIGHEGWLVQDAKQQSLILFGSLAHMVWY